MIFKQKIIVQAFSFNFFYVFPLPRSFRRPQHTILPLEAVAAHVDTQENEEENGKAPERGASVTEERKGNADYRRKAQHHAHVDEDMEQEDAHHAITIDAAKDIGLPLGQVDKAKDEAQEQQQHNGAADETFLLAHGAEDEVGVLLGDVLQLGLRAVEESLSLQSAGTDGNLCLDDIISGAAGIVLQSQKDADARLLVRFQNVVHHITGGKEKGKGADGEQGDIEIIEQAFAQGIVKQVEYGIDTDGQLYPGDVKRYDELAEEQGHERCAQAVADKFVHRCRTRGVDVHHAVYEKLDKEEHHALAQADHRHSPQRVGGKPYADDKIGHSRHGREQDAAGHSLAVHHKEEAEIDKGRTGFLLLDDKQHGHKDDQGAQDEVLPLAHIEAVGSHEFGNAQGRAELGKLGGLDTERPDLDPRHGSLDVTRQQGRDKQQGDEAYIYNVRERLDKTVVRGQDNEPQNQGRDDPCNLHARARAEIQEVSRLVEIVTGTTDAHPAHNEQGNVDDDGEPVK